MNVYSLHRVIDGKWEILVKIKEGEDFRHSFAPRPNIKPLIEQLYDSTPEELAKALLAQLPNCKSVKVSLLCGPAVIMEKE